MRWLPLLVFLAAAGFAWWHFAPRVALDINDEGIYLHGATRMLAGEEPYRDFFALTGPGTYWSHTAVFRLFGVTLPAARIPVTLSLALMTAGVFALTLRLAPLALALLTAFCFFSFETMQNALVVSNHRWESSALGLAAAWLAVAAMERGGRWTALLAGVAAVMAAWVTPPVGLVAAAIGGWLVFDSTVRRLLGWFLAGCAVSVAGGLCWLAAHGILGSMLDALLWSASNYAAPNKAAYGWVIGGFANLYKGADTQQAAVATVLLVFLSLPATLPLLNAVGWPLVVRRQPADRRPVLFLLICSVALVASTWPRPDMIHLMYVSPLAYVLGASLLNRVIHGRLRPIVFSVCGVAAAVLLVFTIQRPFTEQHLETRVGRVRGPDKDLNALRMIYRHVSEKDTLFVYPYWPMFYFFSGARNPTRYPYLQPGMFPESDEKLALEQLQAQPPSWVLYVDVPPESYLYVWPASDPKRLRMVLLEDYFKTRYVEVERSDVYRLLARRE